jgi:hypothetical protein
VPAEVAVHNGFRFDDPDAGRKQRDGAARPSGPSACRPAGNNAVAHLGRKALAAARDRFEGSLAQGFVLQLKAIDFSDQVMMFGAGMLVSLLPFLILLSAFASNRVDDDISLRLGLDRQASGIMTHLFTSSPAR